MSIDVAALDRQQQIWASLYGPARAGEMAAKARELLEADPSRSLKEVAQIVDPEDEGEFDDFAGMRPGVG